LRRCCAALALVILCLLYFTFLGRAGLLGPDEPRYAAIGKAMAQSGDWITPRLWGHPWFEKPPLLFWLTASFFRLGFGPEWAPRFPVALLSAGFLVFLFFVVRRDYGERAAWFASIILASCAGWFAYSHVGVTDLPLSVLLSASMLLAWEEGTERRVAAGILLGLAVLAKALVPLVLFAPAIWFLRRRWKDLLWIFGIAAAVALPWFVLCYARNGMPFVDDLIWKQHFARFTTNSLQHVQPFWYYVPVLLAGIFPWTPVLALLPARRDSPDAKRAFLLAWVLFGFVFFTLSRNKLPGYLLPLLPPLAILAGVGLDRARGAAGPVLAAAAVLTGLIPAINGALPQALISGVTHTHWELPWMSLVLAAAAGGGVLLAEHRKRRNIAFAIPALLLLAGYGQFLVWDLPALDRAVSARTIWYDDLSRRENPSVSNQNRTLRYGICYYANGQLADCPDN